LRRIPITDVPPENALGIDVNRQTFVCRKPEGQRKRAKGRRKKGKKEEGKRAKAGKGSFFLLSSSFLAFFLP
jgi:hypothetical protein